VLIQLSRFLLVGAVSNGLLFSLYWFLCKLGMVPITASTVVYFLGVVQTYLVNRRWTFGVNTDGLAWARYALVYGCGYALTLLLVSYLPNALHVTHLSAQAFSMVVVALISFLGTRYWVFSSRSMKDHR
jgi:putative flippase GtrA